MSTNPPDLCQKCGTDLNLVRAAGYIGHICQPGPVNVMTWAGSDEQPWCDPDEAAPRAFLEHVFARARADAPFASVEVPDETPVRMAKALAEMLSGYADDPASILKTFGAPEDPGVVGVRDLPFASLCEHHVLPFTGTASIAYLPSDRIVGLSKLPRLLRAVTRRLQVQERIGQVVADALMLNVGARGAMVVVRGRHSCMSCRGIESTGEMVTSCVRGVFRDDASARAEALALIG